VVQGSVVGLLLFVLFIYDITQKFIDNKCTYKLYADDLKLYTVLHADEDCGKIQDKLNAIYDWSHNWQLGILHLYLLVLIVLIVSRQHVTYLYLLLQDNMFTYLNYMCTYLYRYWR